MRRDGGRLQDTTTWVFDLDNTLYPPSCRLMEQVRGRITAYVADALDLAPDDAQREQTRMMKTHGTTLRGMVVEHGTDPHAYLAYVEDIDYGAVEAWPALGAALSVLPGRKVIFTNASADHAREVVDRLGVAEAFSGVFDTVAAEFVPKPAAATYDNMVRALDVAPASAVMVEDMARNLRPAAALGMTTVWLRNDFQWARPEPAADYVDHEIGELVDWLTAVSDGGRDANS